MGAYQVDASASESIEPPNGGLRAWIVATGGCAAQMCTFGYINSFGTYQSYYANHLLPDYSPSSISWIGSLQLFLLYFLGFISGPLADRFGMRVVLIPAGVALVLAVMMTSLGTEYYQLVLAQGILGGLANGFIFSPSISCIGQYFTSLRASAMGVAMSGVGIGGVVFPIMLQELHLKVGFPWAVRVIGFMILLLATYMSLTLREFAPRRPKGLFIPAAFTQVPYVLANLALFFGLLGTYTPVFYIVEYSLACGMESGLAWRQVAIFNAASFVGRILPNFVGDRLGRFNMSIVCYLTCTVMCFCWTTAQSPAAIVVWNVFYGFFSGGIYSLYSPTVAQVCPNISHIGTYIGQGALITSFGALAGTPINGALIRRYGYLAASVFSALGIFLGACCLVVTRMLLGRGKGLFAVI